MLFVFNPKAGKGRIKMHLLDIVDIFSGHDYEVIIRATQAPRDAYEKAKEYADSVDLIVCSGGDGTLDEVVTGIMETGSNVPIGYIPAGSTNDFANSLFMPKNMVKAAEMITKEELYHCDIGRFNQQIFAYVAAFGLFTDVSYETDQDLKNVLGHVAYILEGVKRLFDIKSYHMKVTSDELEVEDDFIVGMVTNSRSVGGFRNMIGKEVAFDDGLFEVTLIKTPKNPIALQEIIASLLIEQVDTKHMYTFKTGKITFESIEEIPWTLDGEYGGSHDEVVIENLQKQLHLMVPEDEMKKLSVNHKKEN